MRETQERLRHSLAQRVERLFEDPERGTLALPYSTNGAFWWMHAAVDEPRGALTITSHCPVLTPRDRLGAMCEYLQRCQNDIVSGHFRLDFRDSEVTFRTSVVFGDADVTEELISHLFEGNVDTVEYVLPPPSSRLQPAVSGCRVIAGQPNGPGT